MAELSYWDYLKAAFRHRPDIPGLGPMPVNAMAIAGFLVLGLVSPGFLFLGAAAEIAYLLWLSGNDRFQKMVRGRQSLEQKQSYEHRMRDAVERLSPESQKRFRRLLDESRRIVGISERLGEGEIVSLKKLRGSGLNQLLWIFLRLLTSRELLNQSLARVDRAALESEAGKLAKRVAEASGDPALERSLKATLEIRKKRLDNLDRAERSRQVIDAELERIEQQVALIREETVVGGKAEILSDRLESVTGALSETNSWMEQHAEVFGELGADPLGSAPADLPEIPIEMEPEG
ncbi:MAG: hypothetical protein R3325_05270 [Thermoanaerobaculia bacterium]|nr:hypothetical protein [Thermoanaerobaculia bacterium]